MFRTDCHDEVVIGSPSWVVARSLGHVVCGRGQARASHTHGHYKRVVAEGEAESENTHTEGYVRDLMHHTTSSSIHPLY